MSKVFWDKIKNSLESWNIRLYNEIIDRKSLWKQCRDIGKPQRMYGLDADTYAIMRHECDENTAAVPEGSRTKTYSR